MGSEEVKEVKEVEEVREVEDVRKKCLSGEEKGFRIFSTQYSVSQFPILVTSHWTLATAAKRLV